MNSADVFRSLKNVETAAARIVAVLRTAPETYGSYWVKSSDLPDGTLPDATAPHLVAAVRGANAGCIEVLVQISVVQLLLQSWPRIKFSA